MKKLGFGLMRLPLLEKNDPSSIDIELTKKMVDECLSRGFRYFDTAWMYCGGKSECAVKEVLTDRYPRESFLLADKLHAGYLKTREDRIENRAGTGFCPIEAAVLNMDDTETAIDIIQQTLLELKK